MFRRAFGIIKNFREKFSDAAKNRELVGGDMYGNKYYQIHDHEGYPLKREVVYKDGHYESTMDPIWTNWLKGSESVPPKQSEVEESYVGYLKRKEVGELFDKKDEEMMIKFREAMKKVSKPKQKEFEPAPWKPEPKSQKKY